jgi:hypothetical protein
MIEDAGSLPRSSRADGVAEPFTSSVSVVLCSWSVLSEVVVPAEASAQAGQAVALRPLEVTG